MHRFVSIAVMGAALVGCASDAEDNDAAPQEDVQGEDEAGTEESDAMDADALPDLPPLPERESYREWVKVEPEGRVCGDGSQYKFFAWFEEDSTDVVFVFEPGGACWDYESCSGQGGIRGAANPDGIEDGHMLTTSLQTPLTQHTNPLGFTVFENPVEGFNIVYVPYCTGDVHTGNRVAVYEDPSGDNEPLTYHHEGHANVMSIIEWSQEKFPQVDRMLATGCSAGGAGSQVNYYFLRNGLNARRG